MIVFLLFISLTLHCITFLSMILLFQKLKRKDTVVEDLKVKKQEIEELLTYYSLEMKAENERFMNELLMKIRTNTKPPQGERVQASLSEEVKNAPQLHGLSKKVDQKPSLESQVIRLHEEGYTANEIAKHLHKGQGEIELLLKFQR